MGALTLFLYKNWQPYSSRNVHTISYRIFTQPTRRDWKNSTQ